MNYDVYIPTEVGQMLILAGSGIVGTPEAGTGRIVCDYEGNRYGSSGLDCWADRIHLASSRHADRYPTIARSLLPTEALQHVGTFDDEVGAVELDPGQDVRELVARWCNLQADELEAHLLTRGSGLHQMRRDLRPALGSADPAVRHAARDMARRYSIPAD